MRMLRTIAFAVTLATPAHAASLDGATMSWPWALPFAGLLLTIAAGPTLFAAIWHAHYGKIAGLWAALALVPIAIVYGLVAAAEALTHALLGEFLSFIVVLFALYTVAGGIVVSRQPARHAAGQCGDPWLSAPASPASSEPPAPP